MLIDEALINVILLFNTVELFKFYIVVVVIFVGFIIDILLLLLVRFILF